MSSSARLATDGKSAAEAPTRVYAPVSSKNSLERFLRSRWLDHVIWMAGKAAQTQRRYCRLRNGYRGRRRSGPWALGLESFGVGAGEVVRVITLLASTVVAVSSAIEQFFRFGERWQHYRRRFEQLKSEGSG